MENREGTHRAVTSYNSNFTLHCYFWELTLLLFYHFYDFTLDYLIPQLPVTAKVHIYSILYSFEQVECVCMIYLQKAICLHRLIKEVPKKKKKSMTSMALNSLSFKMLPKDFSNM